MANKTTQTLILKIDNIDIEKVEEFNFLGLNIDTKLNWKKKPSNKCSKTIGIGYYLMLITVLRHGDIKETD